jgi:hypothetical protein
LLRRRRMMSRLIAGNVSLGLRAQEFIIKYGQFIQGVFATVDEPDFVPFMYTIGNHEKGLPELLIVGKFVSPPVAGLLNYLGAKMRADGGLPIGLVDVGAKCPIKIAPATNVHVGDDYTIQVGQYYGTEDYQVLQVIAPDPQGRFPGDPGCMPPYSQQPNLE